MAQKGHPDWWSTVAFCCHGGSRPFVETLKGSACEGATDVTVLRPLWACSSLEGEVRWPLQTAKPLRSSQTTRSQHLPQQVFCYSCLCKCTCVWGPPDEARQRALSFSSWEANKHPELCTFTPLCHWALRNVLGNDLRVLTCLLTIHVCHASVFTHTHENL